MIQKASDIFERLDVPNFINHFPSNQKRNQALEIYSRESKKYLPFSTTGAVTVDKLPLNILSLPFINFLFPNAKYILVVRHPLDTVLSNWMQDFDLNPAMANMVEMDRIVDFYCLAMEMFHISRKKFNLTYHSIRYEDLIINMKVEATDLLAFMGLEWDDNLNNFQRTALRRDE